MTYANVRSAAEHIARTGAITPQQLAAFSGLWESMTDAQRQAFTDLWRAEGSPAAKVVADPATENLQSWLTYFTGEQVQRESKGKIRPLTVAEACGFIGCIIVETGRLNLDRLDVIEAGSGAGRGAMQYTGVRRTAYDKARSLAIAKGVDPNSNRWQQQYFAEEYIGLHDPAAGSLIGWTRIFENRPAGMTPAQAAEYWTGSAATATGYFRPGVPHFDRRQTQAQRVWEMVQAGALKASSAVPATKPTGLVVPAGMVGPSSPFSTCLTPHITLGEFALGQETRRFDHPYQIDTAAELAAFMERCRARFGGKAVIITSGYRPAAINRSVGGASGSEHLFNAPGVGAVDFYIKGESVQSVQDWCDKEWPYSLGYGAQKGFVHLGIRSGRPRVRWDY